MDSGFRLCEFFHLYVLRQLVTRLASRPYAVKGGICLRFFHRSPRLSEDMDLDIDPSMPVKTLQKNVDAILASDALAASLHIHGVRAVTATLPKQTETTQRWKVSLILAGGVGLSTRLEFSRRGLFSLVDRATPSPEVLRAASLVPFVAAFYGAPAMARQKIMALASPSRNAARDLFDLHHLFFTVQTAAEKGLPTLEPVILEKAVEKVGGFVYNDFRDQVLPYLPEDLATLYGNAAAFESLRDQVGARLLEGLP
jgi:predicted nucleotidyltransferase component of viral defense system